MSKTSYSHGYDVTPNVYCSACFDLLNCGEVLGLLPQSTCANCGCRCMGYQGPEKGCEKFAEA